MDISLLFIKKLQISTLKNILHKIYYHILEKSRAFICKIIIFISKKQIKEVYKKIGKLPRILDLGGV